MLRWYINELREITKISIEDEFKLYKFKTAEGTERLLKNILTAQVQWHWEPRDDQTRESIRGAGLILKVLLDGHRKAWEIANTNKNPDEQMVMWKKYRSIKGVTTN